MLPGATFLGLDGPAWFGVGLGAVAGALVSYFFYWKQKISKGIGWAIANRVDLQPHRSFRAKWTLSIVPNLDSGTVTPLNGVTVCDYVVKNTGNQAITPDDFAAPLSLAVDRGFIVDACVTRSSNPDIIPLGSIESLRGDRLPEEPKVTLPAMLLNAGEWITLQVILNDSEPPPPTCRIVGQTHEIRNDLGVLEKNRLAAFVNRHPLFVLALPLALAVLATVITTLVR